VAILFLIVFLDLVGFGLVIPLLPFYVQRVGEGPEIITAILGLYSLAQFVAAPVWGRLSDRFGRKPILVATSFGYAGSFLILAQADTLWLLIASRVFGGLMAGNIAAAQAYVSDVTTPENRAKGMGLIGAAFGLGFVFGPAIGGILAGDDPATANYTAPALVAAALATLAAIGAMIFLKESLAPEHRTAGPARRGYLRLDVVGARPVILMLILSGFLMIAGWAEFETIFGLWANEVLHYGPRQVGFAMTFMAVVSAAIQAGAVGAAARRFSEVRVATAGAVVLVVGYFLLGQAGTLTLMLAAIALLGVGSAFFTPALSSLISTQAGPRDQGVVLGAYQSATALARFAGPAVAGLIYANWGIGAPFQVAALLLLPALALLGLARRRVAA
jgi:DHA1 family tetracycline resistance protein-like MFS transporter